MTVQQLKEALSLKLLAGEEGLSQEVSGCYIGDLLSWVMGRAKAGDAWLTVMGNISALAVASLADTACIILTENAWLDEDARRTSRGSACLARRKTATAWLCRSAGFYHEGLLRSPHPFLPIPLWGQRHDPQ